ncbi:hypothetical protein [Paraburkholderia caribensis]|uniref:hypothetical protein n=1 Tax=Paraburkholderia caribensis TaxID=75105 RepID=UPI001CB52731|nr:hypothetical protein [Paraburkholderia caribensis]CAG9242146.1 conserved hypothetical protein [Paraburkholderia caribensis]
MVSKYDATTFSSKTENPSSVKEFETPANAYAQLLCEPTATLLRCIDQCPQNSSSAILGYN